MVGSYDIEIHLYDPIAETRSITPIRLILLETEFVDKEEQFIQVFDEDNDVGLITGSTVQELIASLDQLESTGLVIDGEFDLLSNIFGSSV